MDLVGAATSAAVLASNISMWPTIRADLGWREFVLVVVVVAAYFNVVGFPRAYVRRFRSGYRSPEWDFDMRLFDEKERLDKLLLEYRPSKDLAVYRRWRDKVMNRGSRILLGIKAMKAPTAEWSAIRDGYVELYGDVLGRVVRDEFPDDADTLRRGTELKERAEILRIAYRTAARQWAPGGDQPR